MAIFRVIVMTAGANIYIPHVLFSPNIKTRRRNNWGWHHQKFWHQRGLNSLGRKRDTVLAISDGASDWLRVLQLRSVNARSSLIKQLKVSVLCCLFFHCPCPKVQSCFRIHNTNLPNNQHLIIYCGSAFSKFYVGILFVYFNLHGNHLLFFFLICFMILGVACSSKEEIIHPSYTVAAWVKHFILFLVGLVLWTVVCSSL